MQNLLREQKENSRLKKGIGNYDPEKPRTISDRVEELERKQYEKGAMIFATQFTSMHKCAETNNLSGLHFFLKTEDVNAKDRWGNTCLVLACERGYPGFVDVLLEHGADPSVRNNKGWTAAHAATVGGHSRIFHALWETGAPVDERDNTGATPAHYAAQADNVEGLMMIHKCQGHPGGAPAAPAGAGDAKDGEDAAAAPTKPKVDVLEGRMNNGNTPAHVAALFDSPAALTYLHKTGADLEARCKSGETPMIKAARAQALRALKFLTDNGSPNALTEHVNVEGDNARALVVDNMRHWRLH